MANEIMYHVSRHALREGTTLTIGIYGERIRRDDFIEANYHKHIKEEIFEQLRLQHYPKMTSRFNAVFLFPELAMAKAYYAAIGGYENYVYAVEILEGEPFLVETDLLRCDGMRYDLIQANAHKYWQQVMHSHSCTLEAILNGKAIVKKMVLEPSTII
jgi:hypothetical protein